MMNFSIKKTLLALAVSSLFINPLQAKSGQSDVDVKEVRNEVGIMLNILQASLKQNNSEKNIRFRAHAVTYLADQGVVFEIASSRRGGHFFGVDLEGILGSIGNIPSFPSPPDSKNGRFEINIDEDEIEDMVREFMEHGDEYSREARGKMRELSEEQRELAWQEREYARTRRDLDFEKRNADADRRKEIEAELKEVKASVKKLESKGAELDKYRKEVEAEHNKQIAKREALKKKLYSQSLALFEDTIGNMLCRYGAGIRSLPEGENVTFLLSDFIDANSDSVLNTHDKVYVFKQKDVMACVTGKSDKNKLLSAAKTYLF